MISKGKSKKLEKNLLQYFCHHKSHMTSHKAEPTVPQQEDKAWEKYRIEIFFLYDN
jgi:hypothetical protein